MADTTGTDSEKEEDWDEIQERIAIQGESDSQEGERKKGPLERMADLVLEGDLVGAGEALGEHVVSKQPDDIPLSTTGWTHSEESSARRKAWIDELTRKVEGEDEKEKVMRLEKRRFELFGSDGQPGTCPMCQDTGLHGIWGGKMDRKAGARSVEVYYRVCDCIRGQDREASRREREEKRRRR